jgi:putative membrane protein
MAVFLVGLLVVALVVGSAAPVAGVLPMLLASGGVVWSRFNSGFGFRAASSPDGVRLRHGLTETRSQTVPPGRVQAVRLTQSLLWRRPDWWRITVNVAGYGTSGGKGRGQENLLLPVGTRDEALAVLSFVAPDLGVAEGEDPRAVVDAALSGSRRTHGFVTSPPAARWLDWISWRRNGFRVTRTVLMVRRGAITRMLDLVPHARTQSLAVTQGPLQRRLGLVHFELHSTPGPVSPQVPHLTEDVGAALMVAQTERARAARAAAGPERWMQQR